VYGACNLTAKGWGMYWTGGCFPTSQKDCQQSQVCKKYNMCAFEDHECTCRNSQCT